jgi:peroxiredoxin
VTGYCLTGRAALALGLLVPAVLGAQDIGLPLGTRAPAVTIEDLDGKPVDLGRYVGTRPVVLEFWATWCPLCAALEPSLKAAHAEYRDRVHFLAVAVAVNETQRSIRRHLAEHPLPFPVLYDADGAAVRAYQAPTTSYIVVLDRTGTVAYTGAGAEQEIAAVLKRVVAAVRR